MSFNRKRTRLAFSVLEVGLVIGILAVVAGFATPAYRNVSFQNDLSVSVSLIAQSLERAKSLSIANKGDSMWGFNVLQSTIFKGKKYATRQSGFDEVVNLPSTITASGLNEVYYSQLTGIISQTGVIILTAKNGSQMALIVDKNGTTVVSEVTSSLIEASNSTHPVSSSALSSSFNFYPRSSSSAHSSVSSSTATSSTSASSSVSASASSSTPVSSSSIASSAPVSSASSVISSSAVATSSSAAPVSSSQQNVASSSSAPVSSSVSSSASASVSSSSSSVSSSSSSSSTATSSSTSSISSSTSSSVPPVSVTWGNQSIAVLLLNSSAAGALSLSGNANMNISNTNGQVMINSNNAAAAKITGNGGATATQFNMKGVPGISTTGNGRFHGVIHTNVTPVADPLASVPTVTPPTQTYSAVNYSGAPLTLNPGTYVGGITITGNTNVTLNPGIYYLQGGGLSISGNATVTGNGVMIYNAPAKATDQIKISGNASLTLSPLTTGIYAGISIFENRTSTVAMAVSGNGILNVAGVLYMPAAALTISGNSSYVNLQCFSASRFILSTLTLGGNGGFSIQ